MDSKNSIRIKEIDHITISGNGPVTINRVNICMNIEVMELL